MEKWFWEDLDAEELDDEITLAKGVIEEALKDALETPAQSSQTQEPKEPQESK